MIFHLKAAQNIIAEHEERDFELIFQFKTARNVVRRHYERDFNIILEKLVADQRYEGNFDMNFLFMEPQTWIAEH